MFPIDIGKIILPQGQQWFTNAMQASGYLSNSEGVCFGLAHIVRDAAFVGQLDTVMLRLAIISFFQEKGLFPKIIDQVKNARKEVIAALKKEYPDDENQPLSNSLKREKTQGITTRLLALAPIKELHSFLSKMLKKEISETDWSEMFLPIIEEIPAFFEKAELYQNPYYYPQLFSKEITPHTQNAVLTESLVFSQELEETIGGIIQTGSFSGIYEEKDLIDFFKQFHQAFFQIYSEMQSLSHFSTVLILESCNHAMALVYDNGQQHWLLCDPNYLSGKSIIIQLHDYERLVRKVRRGFSETEVTAFSTQVYAKKLDETVSRKIFVQWQNQTHDVHSVSIEKASKIDSSNTSWLYIAVEKGNFELVRELAKCRVNINTPIQDDLGGSTPLFIATTNNDITIVKELLKYDANPNKAGTDGATPLHAAAANGYSELIAILVANNASINAIDQNGFTPLHFAARNGFIDAAVKLLDSGAHINKRNKDGQTPLQIAYNSGHRELCHILSNSLDALQSRLFAASANGDVMRMKKLLHAGANINEADLNGMTPLHMAAINGQKGVVSELLANGSNIHATNIYGDTPLHVAAMKGHIWIVEELLSLRKINIDIPNNLGYTPLTLAVFYRQREVAAILKKAVWEQKEQENYFGLFSGRKIHPQSEFQTTPLTHT